MSRAAYSTVSGQPRTFAIAGSLLLVSVSYVLLLSAPVITRHLRSVVSGVGGVKAFEWLPLACGAGLVLGGASALVFVLTQIAREAERRPYVYMAPVLAAFAGCILIGLRADLPLKGVASEHVAVFGLALSVIGGVLVQTPNLSSQLMGLGFTFLPPLSLFVILWMLSGLADPAHVVWGLSPSARAFVGMLTLSSFGIAGIATMGRRNEPARARLPRDAEGYVLYDFEDDLNGDEARMRQRGLPGWAIVLPAAAAVALGFMALKVFLEHRAASNGVAPSIATSAALTSAPAAAPAAAPVIVPGAPALEQMQPVSPGASASPANVVAAGTVSAPAAAVAAPVALQQPVREQAAAQPAAPARKAAAVAVSKPARAQVARPERKVARPAAHSQKLAAPAQRAAKSSAPPAPAKVAAAPAKTAPAKNVEARASVREQDLVEKQVVETKKAPAKPQNLADLAVQAVSLVPPKKSSSSAAKAPAQDDSLDALMDSALKHDQGGSKKKQKASDDPIYGL